MKCANKKNEEENEVCTFIMIMNTELYQKNKIKMKLN